ncbi:MULTISPECIES: glycosyltransferase family 1 protein [Cyanophyceae]|uniref:glycosyltransferase family 4 protein n=1 Tax=Cyanophyceae TaxID=3028117 RepID=UPI00168411F8|nr:MULTISPECIES: glycosyltransferase family 1 protein [Cyanophyceae]MBD1914971.1 glycosyltransferase family 4 protein [Phormidium sp. FACHB-77]MBD2032758.1 glycosyltransferase family 4 protein [Phormidium sp. FACHB-322]MBD2049903.1 glycosyltransferase family 4 protein [Leptolyngbya sp. FACHB-60]
MTEASLLINLAFIPAKPTGLGVYALNLIQHLPKEDSWILSDRPIIGHRHLPSPSGATTDSGKQGHARRLWWTQFQVPRLYRQVGAKLLFSPIPETPLWSSCRTVVTVHDLIPLHFPQKGSPLTLYFRHYLPQVIRQAEHVVCDSESTLRDIHHFFGQLPKAATVVPLAYDADHYRWLDLPRQPYFLYVGSHYTYKNLSRLIEAFAQTTLPDFKLLIAGVPDSRYTPALQAQVEAMGLGDRVQFLAYVPYDELPRLINQAIALVFPSLWEGFGLPVLEAMACGTPVITSNVSSLPEVVGDAALSIDPYNVGELAEAMTAVANDPTLWATLHQAGLARVKAFSWKQTGHQTSEILQHYL